MTYDTGKNMHTFQKFKVIHSFLEPRYEFLVELMLNDVEFAGIAKIWANTNFPKLIRLRLSGVVNFPELDSQRFPKLKKIGFDGATRIANTSWIMLFKDLEEIVLQIGGENQNPS